MMIEQLRLEGDCPISLVYSHGDFSPRHVLTTEHGSLMIDWEMAGHRSALFDLFNVFFRRLWLGYASPGMAVAMQEAIAQVQSYVALSMSAGNSSELSLVDEADVYRRIYYIERVCKVVERQKMTDAVLDKSILRLIDTFSQYEGRSLDSTSQNYSA